MLLKIIVILLQSTNGVMLAIERYLNNKNVSYIIRLIACSMTVFIEMVLAIQNQVYNEGFLGFIINVIMVVLNIIIVVGIILILLLNKNRQKEK